MLRNKKYGVGGAVQSFSSPMLAQGMQGGLSGFGTSGLGTFADGGQVRVVKKDEGNYWYRRTEGAIGSFAWRYDKNYNEGILFPLDKFYSDFYKNVKLKQGEVLFRYETDRMMGRMQPLIKFNLDKSLIYFGVDSDEDEPNFETKGIKAEYIVLEEGYDKKFAKGGEIIDQYEGRNPANIWFNLTKSQRKHLLLDHANIPSGELSSYIDDDTSFDELPHFVKQIVKKHFAEGQYARGGKLSPAQERAFFGKTKTKFTESDAERLVGKFIEIYGQGQDEPIAFSKIAKATIDPKYSQKTLVIYTEMGTQERIPEDKIDAFFNGLTIVLSIPSKGSYYGLKLKKEAYKYANGGEITHLPEAKKVSKEDIEQFIRYVDSFYGKNGVYADYYEGLNSKAQIRKAVMTYLNKLDSQQTWGGGAGDSLDRERVAQILKPTSKPTYAKGGQTSTYEVHLEAVPNRDFDQSSHEANVRVPKLKKSAKSVAEAVSIAKKFIQDNDLGGSNFLPAKLYKNGKQVGFISYNGRVWNNDQSEMKYANGGSVNRKQSKFQLGDKVYSFYNPTKSASIVDLYFKAWDTLDNIPHENDTYFYELSLPDGTIKKLAESALSETPLKVDKSVSKNMDVQFIEYNGNQIMYEPTSKKYYANDVEFDSLLKAKKFLDSGKVSSNIRGAYKKGLFAKGGQTNPKRSRITLIMDGQKYSYPVALVNGRAEVTEETFKDGVVREYLDKEFDLWLQQAPTDYEEMYYGDEDVMSKSGAIEGAMEIVISTIEQEAPKKMTFNFDEGDVEFYEAYQYARGGSIAVSDDEKRKSLKGNLKIKF
jgi:hypothetical protein